MDTEKQDRMNQLIAAELKGGQAAPGLAMTPPPHVPQAPLQPAQPPVETETAPQSAQVALDEHEALMVDALLYRVDAAGKTQALLDIEQKSIEAMKDGILSRCVKRIEVDTAKFNVYINSNTKTITVEERS